MGGVRTVFSDWDGKMGCLDFDGVQADVPTALAYLSVGLDAWNYNSLGLGPGLDVIAEMRSLLTREIMEDVNITKQILIRDSCIRCVQYLSLAVSQQLLVNHFAILFSQNILCGLKRHPELIGEVL